MWFELRYSKYRLNFGILLTRQFLRDSRSIPEGITTWPRRKREKEEEEEIRRNLSTFCIGYVLVTKRDRRGVSTGRDLSRLRRNLAFAKQKKKKNRTSRARGTEEAGDRRYDSRVRDYLPNRSCKTVESANGRSGYWYSMADEGRKRHRCNDRLYTD